MVVLFSTRVVCQSISGVVEDENHQPIPYANIYFRELETGTSTDASGKFFMTINPGIYRVVVSSVGFHTHSDQIIIKDKPVIKNFVLRSSSTELDELVVKVKRRDPAYEIVQHAIDTKEKFLRQVNSSRATVYVRAIEKQDQGAKPKVAETDIAESRDGVPPQFADAETAKDDLHKINLVEMEVIVNYQYPNQFKEERTAYKAYGTKDGLFVPLINDADINFYRNLVHLKGVSEVPVISPLSKTAILSYKYKLEEIIKDDGDITYKIRVTPRKTGDATCRGWIYIREGIWDLTRVDVTLEKGALRYYDEFAIHQTYTQHDSIRIPSEQSFDYVTKSGKKIFRGNTVMKFTTYEPDYVFPPKFFGNEVAVITKEAYEKDTTFWNKARAVPLTLLEERAIRYRDSVHAAQNTKAYLDSIEARFNRVTLGEVLYHGIAFRRQETQRQVMFPGLVQLIGFEVVGGFRFGPYANYFRKFPSGRMMGVNTGASFGVKNADWQGSLSTWVRYNPFRLGDAAIRTGRGFYSVNSFDAYLNQLRVSNYILHEYVDLFHRIELINGLYISTDLSYHNRMSVSDYDVTSVINKVIDEGEPLEFDDYQAFITNLRLAYTPAQRYMREPNQKVVLGSKYPTFGVAYRRGWNRIAGSDVDFDFGEVFVEQNLLLGTLGNSRYHLSGGRFFNTRDLRFIDLKRFRQSDPYLYSDPLKSFQLLDTSMAVKDWFIEGHYIHHFNGALINNIPLVKKLRIRTVAGAGFLWVKESGLRYEELFGGVERVFKLGPRRRLRIGVYGVLSESNRATQSTGYKISFDIIDTWKREWSY